MAVENLKYLVGMASGLVIINRFKCFGYNKTDYVAVIKGPILTNRI